MPGCCGSGGEERTGNSQRRRRRWVLVTALVLIVFGCSVCVITVSVTVSQGKQMRFPYEGMALLAIGVGMMVVHSNCGVQKISRTTRRVPRMENNGLPDTREPQRPPDAPPAYWTVFSLFSSNESPDSTVPPPTSVDSTSLPGRTAQLPPVTVVVHEQSPPTPPPLPPLPTPAVLDVSALTLPVMSTSSLPSSPPPSYPASRCDPDEQNGGTEDFSDTDSLPPEYDDITDNSSGNVESVTTRL